MKQRSLVRMLVAGAALMTTAVVASTPITVTEQRSLDQRIQADVMQVLGSSAELTGRVVVETHDQVVNLSGYLATQGQVFRATRLAGGVQGVRHVNNEIRPRVGAVVN